MEWVFLFVTNLLGEQVGDLIDNNNVCALRKRLDLGFNPDFKMGGKLSLLYSSIDCKKPELTVLLLSYGAKVNLKNSAYVREKTPVDKALDRYNEGLIKLMLTYGADFKIIAKYYQRRLDSPTFNWIKENKEDYCQVYRLTQAGERAYANADYKEAKEKFDQVGEKFGVLANKEDALQGTAGYHTDQIYIDHFYEKSRDYQQKAQECKERLTGEYAPLISHAKAS